VGFCWFNGCSGYVVITAAIAELTFEVMYDYYLAVCERSFEKLCCP
jgi:hypothetical protein